MAESHPAQETSSGASGASEEARRIVSRLPEALEHVRRACDELDGGCALAATVEEFHRLLDARVTRLFGARSAAGEYAELVAVGTPEHRREAIPPRARDLDWVGFQRRCLVLPIETPGDAPDATSAVILAPLGGVQETFGVLAAWTARGFHAYPGWLAGLVQVAAGKLSLLVENAHHRRRAGNVRRFLEDILEGIPSAVVAVDPEGRIVELNRAAGTLLGIGRDEALGRDCAAALPGLPAGTVHALAARARERRTVAEEEVEWTGPAGRTVPLALSASPMLDQDGRLSGVLFVCRDLSESREVAKLRELDEMKSEFVHNTSHELKTPLAAVVGALDLLRLPHFQLRPDQQELVTLAIDGARRLRARVDSILAFSRLEAGKLELCEPPCDLGALLDEVLAEACLPPSHPVERDQPAPVFARVDREKFRRVLENLVSNAVKYTPGGGTLHLSLRREGDLAVFAVRDPGLGIPAEDLPRIFERFHRVYSPETRAIEGTGLGLSICRQVVGMHGGSIEVKSRPGEGSTFTVRLPVDGPPGGVSPIAPA